MENVNDEIQPYTELIFKYFHHCLLGYNVDVNEIFNSFIASHNHSVEPLISKQDCLKVYQRFAKVGLDNKSDIYVEIEKLTLKYGLVEQKENLTAITNVLWMFIGIGYMHTNHTGVKDDTLSVFEQNKIRESFDQLNSLRHLFEDLRKFKLLRIQPDKLDYYNVESISIKTNKGYIKLWNEDIINLVLESLMKEEWSYERINPKAQKDKYYFSERHKVVKGLMNFIFDHTHFTRPNPTDTNSISDDGCKLIFEILKISKIIPDDLSEGSVDASKHIRSILQTHPID